MVSEDGTASGAEDEYQLEEVELGLADCIARIPATDFAAAWKQLEGHEAVQTYQLSSMSSIEGMNNLRFLCLHNLFVHFPEIVI